MAARNHKNTGRAKTVVQTTFFIAVLLIVILHYLKDHGIVIPWSIPTLHAICPFGAVETIGRILTQGKLIPKIHPSNFWMLLAAAGGTLIVGPLFCSWLCPLGSIQDWVAKLGKKLFKKKFNSVPVRLDKALGYMRYVVLGIVIIQTTRMINLVFSSVDPYYALFHFWTGDAVITAILVLAVVLIASLFVRRPWCRWFCPFGAVQGLFQLISPWKIRRNENLCRDCKLCSGACPMKIDITSKQVIWDTRCNRCGECISACPVEGGLSYSLPGKKLKIKIKLLPAVLAVSLFATPVIAGHLTGTFETSKQAMAHITITKPEDIKGPMTLSELSSNLKLEIPELLNILEVKEPLDGSIKLRDIEDINEQITIKYIRRKVEPLLPL